MVQSGDNGVINMEGLVHEVLLEYEFENPQLTFIRHNENIDESSVHEAGCIHTSQGLVFDYVGVIIGEDLRYENGRIITDFTKRASTDQSLKGIKSMYKKDSEKAKEIADEVIKNTYRTLMTRGMKGRYVYCVDSKLAEYLRERL